MASEEFDETSAPRWEERIPCVDESCIGTIAADGICRVCGRPYDGDLPEMAAGDDEARLNGGEGGPPDHLGAEPAPVEDELDSPADSNGGDDWDAGWENRRLCVDESCIGVIGPDGRCKECGREG